MSGVSCNAWHNGARHGLHTVNICAQLIIWAFALITFSLRSFSPTNSIFLCFYFFHFTVCNSAKKKKKKKKKKIHDISFVLVFNLCLFCFFTTDLLRTSVLGLHRKIWLALFLLHSLHIRGSIPVLLFLLHWSKESIDHGRCLKQDRKCFYLLFFQNTHSLKTHCYIEVN